jgi:hypothetical protein
MRSAPCRTRPWQRWRRSTPRRRGWPLAGAAAFALIAATAHILLVPRWTPNEPCTLNFQLHFEADRGRGQWIAFGRSEELPRTRDELAWGRSPPFPWWGEEEEDTLAAAVAPLPAPELVDASTTREGETTWIRGRLRSNRSAPLVTLHIPPKARVEWLRVGERQIEPRKRSPRWRSIRVYGLPPEGAEVELRLTGSPAELIVSDRTLGLPAEGQRLVDLRPPLCVPVHTGDAVWVSRPLRP